MAKQTFTTGQVLTAAQMSSLQQTAMGGGSASVKTTSYVLVAADAGTVIQMNSASATTITVNTSLFSAGDSVQIQNIGAGTTTITAGSATVNSAGSLAVTQYDGGFLYFSSASSALWFDYTQAGTTSPLTTKGDLYTRTSSADARLAVGANGTTLVADSAAATGLKWATPAAVSLANASARVDTQNTLISATYTDLATAGPAVTLTTGTRALVIVTVESYNENNNGTGYASVAVSGATTSAATDERAWKNEVGAYVYNRFSSAAIFTGLTAGSNTFTVKYKKTGNQNGVFVNREIIVVDMGS